jgi:hypothetical protein
VTGLARLEEQFQAFVLEQAPGIERGIVGTERVPVATRLGIYADAYRARLTEALQSNYPVLHQLLGDDQFNDLSLAYQQLHRSGHYSIRWYGDRLEELMRSASPYRERAALAELAAWEWRMTLAFDAADMPTLGREALAGVQPETWAELRFALHPSVHVLALRTNAPVVWRALSRNETPPALDDTAGSQAWLIWRRGLETFYRSTEPSEERSLAAIAKGHKFGDMCVLLADELGEEAGIAHAAQLLARWLEDGLITRLNV